jgi:predicted nucleic acid-binding protein
MNVADLTGLYFIDTNVLVYSFDDTAPEKQQQARSIIAHALFSQRGVISTQVIQEFLNVALRKFPQPMSVQDARSYLHQTLMPLCQHFPNPAFYDYGLYLQLETGFSWFDALIVAAASATGCATLLSEDLQSGRVVRGVTIVNPFAA